MATSRLPEITVTCKPAGHSFATRAHGGQAVDCPECKAGGARVKVWIRKDRPRTARELAEQAAIDGTAPATAATAVPVSAELAARWASEPLWDGQRRMAPGRPGDICPDCDGPLQWELGRTLIHCRPCGHVGLPAAVLAHYERQEQRRGEIAVRGAMPDEAAQRAARVQLRAQKDTVKQRVETWLDTIADQDCYDRVQYQRQAAELAAMLGAYLPEVRDAPDTPTLAAVWRDIDALVTSELGQALKVEYEQAQGRAERQYQERQRAADYARELAAQQAAEQQRQREAERAAEREARELAREQAQQRKAIAGATTTTRRAPATGYTSATVSVMAMIEQNRRAKEKQLETHGQCAYKHSFGPAVASRIYGVPFRDWQGNMNGQCIAGTPQYRACAKHYDAAEAQIHREGYSDVVYWILPL